MTAQQPGVDADPDAIWTPALARGLVRDDWLRTMRCCDGYTDLLGSEPHHRPPRGRMRCPRWVFEHWRVIMTRQLRDEPRVLDVACGPGDLTRFTANLLDDNAFAIGLDDSAFVIKRAARANRHPRAVYMRAEPAQLPFNDRTFDAVCCFAGLNRVPDPDAALSEMVRVLAPGGSIAVLASHGGETPFLRRALEFCARSGGTRTFDRNTVTAAMTSAGLTDIEQQLRGMSQFVTARRPESANQLDAWRVHRRAPR